ncbi:hypothetical protein [Deinococcus aestuarii]|uniref:hypothetical protein n=1 Tax=Deinococcus aestuarii TaxID=2774531 RepID=UPI001C0DA452|nr:hypothetical protein [Deinococcus aestuarii]
MAASAVSSLPLPHRSAGRGPQGVQGGTHLRQLLELGPHGELRPALKAHEVVPVVPGEGGQGEAPG